MHDTKTFIKYIRERVNSEYLSFEKTIYVNRLTPLIITCSIHGDFTKNVSYVKYPLNSNKIGICPKCTIVQRELDRNKTGYGTVYFIWVQSDSGEKFYKLGYTQYKVSDRFKEYTLPKSYKYKVIKTEFFNDPKKAIEQELALHKEFSGYKYIPEKKFYGYDECYEENIFKIKEILDKGI